MKLHKKLHHHFKKHHKKYLAGASLWWVGLLAIKVFVLGTGIFGFLTIKEGVFAAPPAAEYCNNYYNSSACINDYDGVMDGPCLWNNNSSECIPEIEATCSILDEFSCDTANTMDGPCLWNGISCLAEFQIGVCSEYWTNSDACSNASLSETCVFNDQENICVGVNFCSDYSSSYMCSQDYGLFWDCFWDENTPGNCLSEGSITSCNEFGNNETMCTNNDTGLGCFWNGETCIEAICSVLDQSNCESSPVNDGPCL